MSDFPQQCSERVCSFKRRACGNNTVQTLARRRCERIQSLQRYSVSQRRRRLTAVGVNGPGVHKAHSEVVQDRRLVQVAESRQVVLPHQDVGVPQGRQLLGFRVYFVLHLL